MSAAPSAPGFRRTRWAAAGALGAMIVTFIATSGASSAAPAQSGVEPGQGLAIAQTDRVDPRAGGLSIGLTFGVSIAGHQNSVAQASSNALDMGVLGTTLGAEGCDGGDPTLPEDKQPHPIQVDSRDPSAAQGKEEDEKAFPLPIHKKASATPAPFGEAITTTAAYGVPGALEVGAGNSRSYSGLVDDGKAREAKAVTDIAAVTVGPVVQLTGLHWEAVWNSTGDGPQLGTFTIGSAVIGGSPVPTNDPAQVIAQANQALTASQMGIQLAAPSSRQVNGVQFVDPMGIQIVPSHTRDAAASAVLGGAQPAREQLFQALLDADCSNAAGITVADIVLGSLTGAGSLNLTLGGVQASSSEIPENPFKLGTFSLGRPGLNGPLSGGSLGGSSGRPAAQSAGAQPAAGAAAAGPPPAAKNVTPVAALSGSGARGGAMAGVGLGSLALLAGLAVADQRKMRRAQRDIPQFTV